MSEIKRYSLVWFKRDLRIEDHAPLFAAQQHGAVLPIYVFEPELWKQPDMSQRHWVFIEQCLDELSADLERIGQKLIIRQNDILHVLHELKSHYLITHIFSHEETGNYWTYQRDLAVAKWCKVHNIEWQELPNNGVIRRLKSRDHWAELRDKRIHGELIETPSSLTTIEDLDKLEQESIHCPLPHDGLKNGQQGGRKQALKLLNSFLYNRGENYTRGMSSPNTAFTCCSRLSPYISYGSLSIKELILHIDARRQELHAQDKALRGNWLKALQSFVSRLYWHCHFIQKLEDEPRQEFENLHPAFNGLREQEFDQQKFIAWSTGNTGYPFVDACMRALIETGWINFRMRAMLMSFASYHLWLHWREPALHLARMFTDYEPGIHYSQVQMQAGTTGINLPRMYNPVKQSMEQDERGHFIRKYVPELKHIPAESIHEPWLIPPMLQEQYKCTIGKDYPEPIIELKTAITYAREKIKQVRSQPAYREFANKINQKHGSRKKSRKKSARKTDKQPDLFGQ